VRLEGLGKLKKKIHLIGTRTRDLPACSSIVPQSTTLPRAPDNNDDDDDNNNNNNSIQFFIIYVPSQQLQGQLQTQHSVDTSNYIMGNIT
jgi:hypothetical protein